MTTIATALALLMLASAADAQAGATVGGALRGTPMILAAGSDYEPIRRGDREDAAEQGPLSVHVTTFDRSPTTAGMWYEKPRRDSNGVNDPAVPNALRTPFDRDCTPGGCD